MWLLVPKVCVPDWLVRWDLIAAARAPSKAGLQARFMRESLGKTTAGQLGTSGRMSSWAVHSGARQEVLDERQVTKIGPC